MTKQSLSASDNRLERFIEAQARVFDVIRAELQAGQKRTHWMWFVFPQLRGLGRTETAFHYGIVSVDEALRYWRHPVLGPRLKRCVEWVLETPQERSALDIFGSPDDLKFRSCLTLFHRVAPDEPTFSAALARFYRGLPDPQTLLLLAEAPSPKS